MQRVVAVANPTITPLWVALFNGPQAHRPRRAVVLCLSTHMCVLPLHEMLARKAMEMSTDLKHGLGVGHKVNLIAQSKDAKVRGRARVWCM